MTSALRETLVDIHLTQGARLHGFDYVAQQPAAHRRKEWNALIKAIEEAGGRRVQRDGEIFAFNDRGVLLLEVYPQGETA